MSRHERYTQAILKINAMREQLRKDPSSKDLARKIEQEEEKLFEKERNIGDSEIEQFFRQYGIEICEDDED